MNNANAMGIFDIKIPINKSESDTKKIMDKVLTYLKTHDRNSYSPYLVQHSEIIRMKRIGSDRFTDKLGRTCYVDFHQPMY